MGGACRIRKIRTSFYQREPGGKKPLERPENRWKDNIKMDLRLKSAFGLIIMVI
jgi:hypothetical protein